MGVRNGRRLSSVNTRAHEREWVSRLLKPSSSQLSQQWNTSFEQLFAGINRVPLHSLFLVCHWYRQPSGDDAVLVSLETLFFLGFRFSFSLLTYYKSNAAYVLFGCLTDFRWFLVYCQTIFFVYLLHTVSLLYLYGDFSSSSSLCFWFALRMNAWNVLCAVGVYLVITENPWK